MRRLLCLALLAALSHPGFSQTDSTSYQKLLRQFTEAYKASGADADKNYYEQLTEASFYTLRLHNPVVHSALKELDQVYPGKTLSWSIQKLADSLLYEVSQSQLWVGREAELEKNKATLELYTARSCDCLSARLTSEEAYRNLLAITQECDGALQRDALFMNRVAVSMVSLTPEEKMRLPLLASRYGYTHCPAMYRAMNDGLLKEIQGKYDDDLDFLTARLDEKVVALWTKGKEDSLQVLFPTYKKAEQALKNTSACIQKSKASIYDRKETPGQTTVTRTFINDYNHPQLLGQVEYSYSVNGMEVRMIALKFIPVEHIPNREALLKELKDIPPPPPMELLPGGKN